MDTTRFVGAKTVTIYVEGTPHPWPKDEITYAEVVTLEVPDFELGVHDLSLMFKRFGQRLACFRVPDPGRAVR